MAVTQDAVVNALSRIRGPDLSGNIVDLGLVSEVVIKDGRVSFAISVPVERAAELEPLRQAAQKVVSELDGVTAATVVLTADRAPGQAAHSSGAAAGSAPASGGQTAGAGRPRAESPRVQAARGAAAGAPGPRPLPAGGAGPQSGGGARAGGPVPGVKAIIAVASGKGGVGKSTVAVNLALAFRHMGLAAGIMDADIYGPSQPRLLGLSGRPNVLEGDKLEPKTAYGLKAMSIGLLIDEATPMIWRGPMAVSALNQMLRDVDWASGGQGLDVLVIDMPPGTGDIQLSLSQQVPLTGAVIVSTPQDLALIDARKGIAMFNKVEVPVLGIIENMSYFVCPKCGEQTDIFSHGGAEEEAKRLGVPFLGAIPLHMDIRSSSDAGKPIMATTPDSTHAQAFLAAAETAWAGVSGGAGSTVEAPKLDLSPNRDALRVSYADGARYELSAEMLRVMSPSAEVQGHSPSQRVTVAGKRNVRIRDMQPVGHYAVRIVFDDGHDTGLYSWTYLRELGGDKDRRWAAYLAELEQKGQRRD